MKAEYRDWVGEIDYNIYDKCYYTCFKKEGSRYIVGHRTLRGLFRKAKKTIDEMENENMFSEEKEIGYKS